jgi:hypothetical protein
MLTNGHVETANTTVLAQPAETTSDTARPEIAPVEPRGRAWPDAFSGLEVVAIVLLGLLALTVWLGLNRFVIYESYGWEPSLEQIQQKADLPAQRARLTRAQDAVSSLNTKLLEDQTEIVREVATLNDLTSREPLLQSLFANSNGPQYPPNAVPSAAATRLDAEGASRLQSLLQAQLQTDIAAAAELTTTLSRQTAGTPEYATTDLNLGLARAEIAATRDQLIAARNRANQAHAQLQALSQVYPVLDQIPADLAQAYRDARDKRSVAERSLAVHTTDRAEAQANLVAATATVDDAERSARDEFSKQQSNFDGFQRFLTLVAAGIVSFFLACIALRSVLAVAPADIKFRWRLVAAGAGLLIACLYAYQTLDAPGIAAAILLVLVMLAVFQWRARRPRAV